uniref:Uncharacterized protein n=1 Tax=viral metagenome TaxID=1070528 RepID=A0A6M3KMV7_9ZZZZ
MLQNVLDSIQCEISADKYYLLRQKIALVHQSIIEAIGIKREIIDGKKSRS